MKHEKEDLTRKCCLFKIQGNMLPHNERYGAYLGDIFAHRAKIQA